MKTIETVRADVKAKRGADVAATVNLDGRVNFSTMRDLHIVGAFPHVWVEGKSGGAIIGCRDKRFHIPELEACVDALKSKGFKVRKLPGGYEQYSVT